MIPLSFDNPYPWHFDPIVYEKAQEQTHESPYHILEAGPSDYRRVISLYLRSPVAGFQIVKVEAVYNEAMEKGFEAKIRMLEGRWQNQAFEANWKEDSQLASRRQVSEWLDKEADP